MRNKGVRMILSARTFHTFSDCDVQPEHQELETRQDRGRQTVIVSHVGRFLLTDPAPVLPREALGKGAAEELEGVSRLRD